MLWVNDGVPFSRGDDLKPLVRRDEEFQRSHYFYGRGCGKLQSIKRP